MASTTGTDNTEQPNDFTSPKDQAFDQIRLAFQHNKPELLEEACRKLNILNDAGVAIAALEVAYKAAQSAQGSSYFSKVSGGPY